MGRQATGAEGHIEVGGVVGQGRHQGAALVDAGLLEGFIEGGIGQQHPQAPLLGLGHPVGVHFHHEQRHVLGTELFGDFAADAAVAAENHVVMHAPQLLPGASIAKDLEVTGVG